jgi:Na+-transporting methylmalonyl-CoA/oxaloacetate decarboxylase gamma subunit
MEDALATSLIVTGLGMLFLFAAMGLLYGFMVAMTALIKSAEEDQTSKPQAIMESTRRDGQEQRVAAIAVGLARAELEAEPHAPARPGTAAKPWRQYHHQRLLNHPRHRGTVR